MVEALIGQSCLTFATPWTVACQAPSDHGTSQTSILRLPFPCPGDLPPRDWTQVSHIAGRLFTVWATRQASYFCMHAQSLQLWTALCNSIDCSPPGFSVHGILQARILEWVLCPPLGDFPDLGIELTSACISCIAGGLFTHWTTWESPTLAYLMDCQIYYHSSVKEIYHWLLLNYSQW